MIPIVKIYKDKLVREKVRIRVPHKFVLDEELKVRLVRALYPDALVYATKDVVFVCVKNECVRNALHPHAALRQAPRVRQDHP